MNAPFVFKFNLRNTLHSMHLFPSRDNNFIENRFSDGPINICFEGIGALFVFSNCFLIIFVGFPSSYFLPHFSFFAFPISVYLFATTEHSIKLVDQCLIR